MKIEAPLPIVLALLFLVAAIVWTGYDVGYANGYHTATVDCFAGAQ